MMFLPAWIEARVLFCVLVLAAWVHRVGPW